MEKENHVFLNSPIIQKNTPIKRLGLSRKRKSSGSVGSPIAKIQACDENSPNTPSNSDISDKYDTPSSPLSTHTKVLNYEEEVEKIKKKISEDEEKLKSLCKKNIIELENLIELWKNGCRNAFLHLIQLLKEKQQENVNYKAVLSKLGIWETMLEHFETDSELSLFD